VRRFVHVESFSLKENIDAFCEASDSKGISGVFLHEKHFMESKLKMFVVFKTQNLL
jgi:hypothetical protein